MKGSIYVQGKKVVIDSPNQAIELGIGMVHQHFKLVQPFTVTENIILGMEPKKWIERRSSKQRKRKSQAIRAIWFDVWIRMPESRDISVGMQQRVEILKTLYRGADILIFDEPTAVLTPQEIT